MSTLDIERMGGLAAGAVNNVLANTGRLIACSELVKKTGRFETVDELTGESVYAVFDEKDKLESVDIKLLGPKGLLTFEADGSVTIAYRNRGSKYLFGRGEVSQHLSLKEQRQALGYIAAANALVEEIVEPIVHR